MKARTGNQSVAVVIAVSLACVAFVYYASTRVQSESGEIDAQKSVIAPNEPSRP